MSSPEGGFPSCLLCCQVGMGLAGDLRDLGRDYEKAEAARVQASEGGAMEQQQHSCCMMLQIITSKLWQGMLLSSCMLMLRVPDPSTPHLQASGFGLFPGFTSTALCHRQLRNCQQGVVDLDALAYACGVEKALQPAAAWDTHRTPQVFQAAAFSRGEKWGLAGTACCLLPAACCLLGNPQLTWWWQKSLKPHHLGDSATQAPSRP
jgi:hypothetical protein